MPDENGLLPVELSIDLEKPDLELWEIQKGMKDVLRGIILTQRILAERNKKLIRVNKMYKSYYRRAALLLHHEESTKTGEFEDKKPPATQTLRDVYVEKRIDEQVLEEHAIDDFCLKRWSLEQEIATLRSALESWVLIHKVLRDLNIGETSMHKYGGTTPGNGD